MRKVLCFGLPCAAFLLVLGCKTMITAPFVYTNNESSKFEILGEIRYESSDRNGYTEMLAAARKLYPDCDYVIDIMIDCKTVTTILFFWKVGQVQTYKMSGTAIKYVR